MRSRWIGILFKLDLNESTTTNQEIHDLYKDNDIVIYTEIDFLRRSARCSKLDRIRNSTIRQKMNFN